MFEEVFASLKQRHEHKHETPKSLLMIDKITSYFGDLDDEDSAFVFKLSASKMLELMDDRLRNLEQAINEGNKEKTKFFSHQLRGSFNTMGCPFIASICQSIENATNATTTVQLHGQYEMLRALSGVFEQELSQLIQSLN